MKYSTLGHSELSISRVCLGSMTWGTQNTQADANQQIEYALSQDINFIDTAEMYSIPPSQETYGGTEKIIGHWLSENSHRRKDIVLASKIAGSGLPWVRNGADITGQAVIQSVDASLQRLQTDYIDLYQLHWPNRTSPHFGKHWPNQIALLGTNPHQNIEQMLDILEGLAQCVKAGKIRYCGLSNDTPWGINTYLKLSEKYDLPRIVSVQNEFSLLHTKDWPYVIENCINENIAYLPWSPLGGGILSGKYLNGALPKGSRWTLAQRNGLFRDTEVIHNATQAYSDIAKKHGYTPAQLALAWCDHISGVTSSIIGSTSLAQLKEDINAYTMPLNEEILNEIESVLKMYPVPF